MASELSQLMELWVEESHKCDAEYNKEEELAKFIVYMYLNII